MNSRPTNLQDLEDIEENGQPLVRSKITGLIYLRQKDNDYIRALLVKEQDGKCILCERSFDSIGKTACIDHDHKTGRVRAALCTHCNAMAGKIEYRANIAKQQLTVLDWLNNFNEYVNQPQRDYMHTTMYPKMPILPKRLFNKLKKHFPNLKYPASGTYTKPIKDAIHTLNEKGLIEDIVP